MEQILTILFFIVYIIYQVYKASSSSKEKRPRRQRPRTEQKAPTLEDILREMSGEQRAPGQETSPTPAPRRPIAEQKDNLPPSIPTLETIPEFDESEVLEYGKALETVDPRAEQFADHSSHISDRKKDQAYGRALRRKNLAIATDRSSMQKAIIYAEILNPRYF